MLLQGGRACSLWCMPQALREGLKRLASGSTLKRSRLAFRSMLHW